MNKLKERNSKDISRSSDLTTKVLINPVTETKEIQLFCCNWVLQRRVKEDDSLCRFTKQIAFSQSWGEFQNSIRTRSIQTQVHHKLAQLSWHMHDSSTNAHTGKQFLFRPRDLLRPNYGTESN